ncbi:MAG: YihY/virulence factor BrkB family protein [Thermoplasmata archaeon]|nr:MAG: YihY/virulence factor BrkB family protein [Deltaproteobacteria bacterium]RLF56550.1 MAG: YihY/virulence factor BrkB family protein [Thermoplasmata archaeon]HDZ23281.1 YihY family inner membrane protein [Desulfobacteraceae bacterium]
MLSKTLKFAKRDIWRIQAKDLPRGRFYLLQFVRITILTLRGLSEDKIQLRASALTFYSLISVVPVAAMILAFAKGFGFQRTLEREVLKRMPGQEEIATRIIDFAQKFLANVQGGLIAGLGFVVLFWAIMRVLGNIETSFNDIWGVKKGRPIGRKITDYLAISLIYPILFVSSSAMTVVATSQVSAFVHKISVLSAIGPVIFFLLKLVPYGIIFAMLAFIYIFMPNTKVNLRSGILAGLIAGVLYQGFQFGYIKFQIGVSKYNAIYGSFAALPLFLIWLQVSWLIVFLGAEIAFAYQNVHTYEFEPDCLSVSHSLKRLVSLAVVHMLVQRFTRGQEPLDGDQISRELEIPIRLVRQILFELMEANIISPVQRESEKDSAYQPAVSPDSLTIKEIIDALDQRGTDDIPFAKTEAVENISECLIKLGKLVENAPENRRLIDI